MLTIVGPAFRQTVVQGRLQLVQPSADPKLLIFFSLKKSKSDHEAEIFKILKNLHIADILAALAGALGIIDDIFDFVESIVPILAFFVHALASGFLDFAETGAAAGRDTKRRFL